VPRAPMTMIGGSRMWSARASSIAGIEAELARIWGAAANEEREEELPPDALAEALGDPHLAGRLDAPGDVGVRMRTSVLTLVVVASRPETEERVLGTIGELAARHPSRTIVLAPGDPDGPARLDARIFAACQVPERGGPQICTEQILLRTGGEADQHLAALVHPLLIHDLPVMLWWPDDPPFGHSRFSGLVGSCDRLLVDSGTFREDGGSGLAGLAALGVHGPRSVASIHDVGWLRLTRWRELLAGLFDHPLLAPELHEARSLRIDVLQPRAGLRPTWGALFAGWVGAALGWSVETPLAPGGDGGTLAGAFHSGRGTIPVEIRPAAGSPDRDLHAPGSLLRVELKLGRRAHEVRARVTRQADHLLATADWQGAEVARRVGPLEAHGEAPYLAVALEHGGPDRMLGRAVALAARLLGA
jgi:glucose-6-phosphate dehydrogenase assembly protein OpcA